MQDKLQATKTERKNQKEIREIKNLILQTGGRIVLRDMLHNSEFEPFKKEVADTENTFSWIAGVESKYYIEEFNLKATEKQEAFITVLARAIATNDRNKNLYKEELELYFADPKNRELAKNTAQKVLNNMLSPKHEVNKGEKPPF